MKTTPSAWQKNTVAGTWPLPAGERGFGAAEAGLRLGQSDSKSSTPLLCAPPLSKALASHVISLRLLDR